MRTTLTIDDDLAGLLKRKAHELGKPFKEVVNLALRKGLADNVVEKRQKLVTRVHDFGDSQPGLDWNRLNQLVDELEADDYLRKARPDDSTGH